MKLDALDHPKTLDFAARLGVSRPTAIGHLELLWHFVAKHSPQGNVGRFPDGAIARACDWMGDPECFLNCLLKSGFLDDDTVHRYLVHDWPEHCPNWVRSQLNRLKQQFSTPTPAESADLSAELSEGSTRGSPPTSRAQILPSQAMPSHAMRKSAREPERTEVSNGEGNGECHRLVTEIQAVYPAGTYRGSNWILAEREISKLLDAGEPPELLLAHARAFATQQAAKGSVGTQYVLSPEKFYGPDGHWRGPFPLPKPASGTSASVLTIDELKAKYPCPELDRVGS